MPTFEVTTPEGKTLEINAPEGATKEQALAYAKANYKPSSVNAGGVAAEGGKGFLRGASDTALTIGEGAAKAALGPVVGELATRGIRALAEPSRTLVQGRPASEAERFAGTAGEIAGGGLAGGGAGTLRSAALTGASALGGAVGEQLGGDAGKILGAVAPSLPAVGSAIRTAAANPQKVAQNVQSFERAGAGTPSVGQATASTFFQGLENLVSRFPGGSGVMQRFAKTQQEGMGRLAETGVSAEDAGRAIESGVRGSGGFLERTKAIWQRLDNDLAAKVPAGTGIAPAKTVEAVQALTTPTLGAERTTGALINPKLAELKANLTADLQANNGTMPFEALRSLRSRVGSMLEDSLVSGIPNGELKKVYGALSSDMEAAAKQAGAGREFARQNDYYRARMDRIESVLDRVIGSGKQPEDIFKAVMPTDPNQANKLRAVMRSLPEDDRKVVTDAVVSRLGRATPGRQNDVGDVFSANTFLTNWNKLSDGAKAQLFTDGAMRSNLDALASTSSNIKEGAKVFANPSGTAGAAAPYGLTAMAATGNVAPAVGMIAGANVGARMLTSPKVVQWLATAPKSDPQRMAGHLARLGVIFNATKDEALRGELSKFINQ